MVVKVLPGLAAVHVREAESGAAYAALVPGAAFAEFPGRGLDRASARAGGLGPTRAG